MPRDSDWLVSKGSSSGSSNPQDSQGKWNLGIWRMQDFLFSKGMEKQGRTLWVEIGTDCGI